MEREKDPQRRAPKRPRVPEKPEGFLGEGATAGEGDGHGSDRAERRVAT